MNERLTDIVEKTNLKILTSVGHYLPGYKAGGPIRTLATMVERLGDEFQFKIVTVDRDFGDERPYRKIKIDSWNRTGRADIFYMSPKLQLLRFTTPDAVPLLYK